jgi:hypothetical protein
LSFRLIFVPPFQGSMFLGGEIVPRIPSTAADSIRGYFRVAPTALIPSFRSICVIRIQDRWGEKKEDKGK